MIVALTIALIAGLSQAPAAPETLDPYIFTFSDGTPDLYALADSDDFAKGRYFVLEEQPWNRANISREIIKHKLSDTPQEGGASYRAHMKVQWEANGGMQLGDTPDSPWVLKSEYELMQKAQALAQPVVIDTAPLAIAPLAPELVTADTVEVGFMAQWWRHILILGAVLVLSLVLIRWGFFAQVWLGVQ
jgi:hypothetical protein